MTEDTYTDLRLDPTGEAATQRELSHGIVRTVLLPGQTGASLGMRYDSNGLVAALTVGPVPLADGLIDHLWQALPDDDTTHQAFADLIYDYLQSDARSLGENADVHALLVLAVNRDAERLWIGWLGTSGVRALNVKREPLSIEAGLLPGEGWSPKAGVVPEAARPHATVLPINQVDRLLLFSNALRPSIDELPYLGRATVQRLADAVAEAGPVALFDLHPYRVVAPPEELQVQYRWESPYQVALLWTGSPNATSYRVEQASLPTFEDAATLAELMDARQRLYHVQPPSDQEAYYRVIPTTEDVDGRPSQPVVVTPVPLMPPIIDTLQWLEDGGQRIGWTPLPQANTYELEASPDPDFDSPETLMVYRGEQPYYDSDSESPIGWYYRVRSVNTYFAPKTPSAWSPTRHAPVRLETPTFERVSGTQVTWMPVEGASLYELRQITRREGHDTLEFQVIGTVENLSFTPSDKRMAALQIRALRAEGDEETASVWSKEVVVAGKDSILSTDTAEIPVMEDVGTTKLHQPTRQPETAMLLGLSFWQLAAIAAAVALALGLLIGLIGGPRLGIGMDPTATPVSGADRQRTATQLAEFVDSSTQEVLLGDELGQANALATENAHRIATQEQYNAALNDNLSALQATATQAATDLAVAQAIATQDAVVADADRATAVAIGDRDALTISRLETQQANVQATLTALEQTATFDAAVAATQQAELDAEIDRQLAALGEQDSTLAALRETATFDASVAAAQQAERDAEINRQAATLATLDSALTALEQTATFDASVAATRQAQVQATAVANASTITAQSVYRATVDADLATAQAAATMSAAEIRDLQTQQVATATAHAEEIADNDQLWASALDTQRTQSAQTRVPLQQTQASAFSTATAGAAQISALQTQQAVTVTHQAETYATFSADVRTQSDVEVSALQTQQAELEQTLSAMQIDADGDGVLNADDACPVTPGVEQANGCPANQPPIIEAIPTVTCTVGDEIRVPLVYSDPDDEPVMVSVAIETGSESVAVAVVSEDNSALQISCVAPGEVAFAITITDASDGAASMTLPVTVAPPAPLLAFVPIPVQQCSVGETITVDVLTDPPADNPLVITSATLTDEMVAIVTLPEDSGKLGVTCTAPGTTTIEFVAQDSAGNQLRGSFELTVADALGVLPSVEESLATTEAYALMNTVVSQGPANLRTIVDDEEFTLLVPPDEVWPRDQRDRLADRPRDREMILRHHLIRGQHALTDLQDGMELETFAGTIIVVKITETGDIMLNDIRIVTQIETRDGWFFEIDRLMPPPLPGE